MTSKFVCLFACICVLRVNTVAFGQAGENQMCVELEKDWQLIEKTFDRCSYTSISILTQKGLINLFNGGIECFKPEKEEWYWYCGNLRERTRCRDAVIVKAEKDSTGRRIIWNCYGKK